MIGWFSWAANWKPPTFKKVPILWRFFFEYVCSYIFSFSFFVTGLKKRFLQFFAAQSFFIICIAIYKLNEEKIDETYDNDNLYNVKGFFGNVSKWISCEKKDSNWKQTKWTLEYVLFWIYLNPYNHMIFEVFGTLFTFIVLL